MDDLDAPIPESAYRRKPVRHMGSRVDLRVPVEEAQWWKDCATDLGLTLSAMVRWCVSHTLVSKFDPPDEIDMTGRRTRRLGVPPELEPGNMEEL